MNIVGSFERKLKTTFDKDRLLKNNQLTICYTINDILLVLIMPKIRF